MMSNRPKDNTLTSKAFFGLRSYQDEWGKTAKKVDIKSIIIGVNSSSKEKTSL